MGLKEYKPGTTFSGVIGRTYETSEPAWPEPQRARKGTPNVLFIVLDDTGFGHLGCYGSPISTPNLDRLAAGGLRYMNMHTTALCSPTRSCILTGRNHHSNHLAAITEVATGFPGYDGYIPFEHGFLSEYPQGPGLQRLRRGQVASDAGRPDLGRWTLRSLAAGTRLRALLRLPRRRYASVLSGTHLRQPPGGAREDARTGLPPQRGPRGPGHLLPGGLQAGRT